MIVELVTDQRGMAVSEQLPIVEYESEKLEEPIVYIL